MANFILGLIIGSMSNKNNKSNEYGSKSVAPPKPKLPPTPNTKVGTNPSPKSKSPGPPGSSNELIELKFCEGFNWYDVRIVELNSFEEFFLFYMENNEKGLIYDVRLKE